jgi:D-amino peptidase
VKILIAADMEGVTGVVNWEQVSPGRPEYVRFRRLMTADVNAAVKGAFEAGATEVIVTDGHGGNCNLLIEELDPRARLNSGGPSPLAMVQGVDEPEVKGVLFVGYHARAGASPAILDHTWTLSVANLWLNGQPVGEIGLNAAVCGHFDAPVLMISGDQTATAEAVELLGNLEIAVVKQARGQQTADCLPPERAQQAIFQAAVQAVRRLKASQAPEPFRPGLPITVTVEFTHSVMADRAVILPGATRAGERQVQFTADDMVAAYRAFRSLVGLAGKTE